MRVDIVIVGAGLVGSTLACSLAESHPSLSVLLIEAGQPGPSFDSSRYDSRVVALNPSSIRFLDQHVGVWPEVEPSVCSYRHMKVWDGEGNGSIGFDSSDLGDGRLGCIVENSLLLSNVQNRLLDYRNVQLLCPAEVDNLQLGECVQQLTLVGGQTVNAELVIAADGARSTLRTLAGLNTREWAYGHDAIITTVKTEQPHKATAWQRFSQQGPLAFLPLRDIENNESERYCSIVWSLKRAAAEEKMAMNTEEFCHSVAENLEFKLGEVSWCDARHRIPLTQRHAKDYGFAGFVLVGDAAHSIHPLAGQGVNLGFADIEVLSGEITRALARSIPLSHISILKRYQRARKPQNLLTMAAMEGFKRLFEHGELPLVWVRNRGMAWVDKQTLLKQFFVNQAS